MKLKVTCIGLALAGLVCIAHAQKRDESEVVNVGKGDPDMAAAIQQARATLPDFLALAAKPPAGTEEYKLKVQVVDGRQTEHFWVTPFEVTPDGFSGVLANSPKVVRNVKAGQVIQFKPSAISDWGYTKDGRQVGSYTVCVLFKKMPAEQANYYRTHHGFDC